ncbi:MAG: hypothetical protein Q9192_007009 [Flavoplaca navasiana]
MRQSLEDEEKREASNNHGEPDLPRLASACHDASHDAESHYHHTHGAPSLPTHALPIRSQSSAMEIPVPQNQSRRAGGSGGVLSRRDDVSQIHYKVPHSHSKTVRNFYDSYEKARAGAIKDATYGSESLRLRPKLITDFFTKYTALRDLKQMTPSQAKLHRDLLKAHLDKESSPAVWGRVFQNFCLDAAFHTRPDKELESLIASSFCGRKVYKEMYQDGGFVALLEDRVLALHVVRLLLDALDLMSQRWEGITGDGPKV